MIRNVARAARRQAGLAAAALLAAAMLPVAALHAEQDGVTKTWAIAEFGEPLYRDGFTHWPYANADAPKGGSIVLGAFGSFDSLNPYVLKGQWARSIGLIADSLMVGSGDELSTAYGLIAETAEYPADKSWIIFNLRPEARFHDGVPITAHDFVYSFEVIREHGRPFLKSFYKDVAAVEALSDQRLKFSFTTTDNMKPLLIVASTSPLPRHYWAERDITRATLEPPLGSGAYRITEVVAGRSITYDRVRDYWAADLPVNRGLNNFDRIRYDYYRDSTAQFEAFKGGEIDFRQENRAKNWATAYDFTAVEDGRVTRRAIPSESPRGLQGYFFNLRRPQLQDVRVREAISLLFDFETTQRLLLYGQYTRSKSFFPNSDFGVDGPPTPEELAILDPFKDQLRPEVLAQAFEPSKTDGSGRIRRNMRAAQRLFKAAGWQVKDGKLVNGDTGKQLTLEIMLRSPTMEKLTEPFAQNMRRAGIEASYRVVDTAQFRERLNDFDFDMLPVTLNFFPPPGPELRSYYGSAAASVRGSANFTGIENPVADALIEQIIAARDLEQLKATTRALDRVLLWEFAAVPQFHNDETWLAYWNIFDYPERKPRYSTGFPGTWWIDQRGYAALRQARAN